MSARVSAESSRRLLGPRLCARGRPRRLEARCPASLAGFGLPRGTLSPPTRVPRCAASAMDDSGQTNQPHRLPRPTLGVVLADVPISSALTTSGEVSSSHRGHDSINALCADARAADFDPVLPPHLESNQAGAKPRGRSNPMPVALEDTDRFKRECLGDQGRHDQDRDGEKGEAPDPRPPVKAAVAAATSTDPRLETGPGRSSRGSGTLPEPCAQ